VIGWKVGFGSPAALERLGLERPLVAPLPASGRLPDGATVDVAGWTAPVLEAEIAVWVGRGYGVAIELADVDVPPDGVAAILAGGIYHRHVLLGPPVATTIDGVSARVLRDGEEVAATDDPTALTGALDFVLESVELHAGRPLRDGEVVIAGSVVPPVPVAPGQHWLAELLPLGTLQVRIAAV
jgi:2-keto-4-pentenoate hydratase